MKALFLFQRSKDKEDELKLGSGGFGGGSSSEGKRRKEGMGTCVSYVAIWMNSPVMCLFVATFQDHKHFKASLNLENIIQVIIWAFYNSMSI